MMPGDKRSCEVPFMHTHSHTCSTSNTPPPAPTKTGKKRIQKKEKERTEGKDLKFGYIYLLIYFPTNCYMIAWSLVCVPIIDFCYAIMVVVLFACVLYFFCRLLPYSPARAIFIVYLCARYVTVDICCCHCFLHGLQCLLFFRLPYCPSYGLFFSSLIC